MKRKIITLYIIPALLVATGGTIWYVTREYKRVHKETAFLEPDYILTAPGIIKEFEADKESSGKKYWDKVILVEGMVKEVIRDEGGHYSISLGDTSSVSAVRCSMDTTQDMAVNLVKQGGYISVKGICAGFNSDELLGSDVILVRCIIEGKQ
jgi:hypothetical protein